MLAHHRPPPTALLFFLTVLSVTLIAGDGFTGPPILWAISCWSILAILAVIVSATGPVLRRTALVVAFSFFAAHLSLLFNHLHDDVPLLQEWLGEDRHRAELTMEIVDGPIFHDRGLTYDALLLDIDVDLDGALTNQPPKVRLFYPTAEFDHCAPLPLPGDRLITWARIERFAPADVPWRASPRQQMERRGYSARVTALEPAIRESSLDLSATRRLQRALTIQRLSLELRIAHHLDGDGLAITWAMLTGSRGLIEPEFREPFDITSTGHILAISGLHFGVIAALIWFVLRLILDRLPRLYRRVPRRTLIGTFTLLLLLLYLLAIGAPVSARRAFGMCALAIAFLSYSPWRLRPLSALFFVAGILLLLQPHLIDQVGYRLSVSATAGILLFHRARPCWLRRPTPDPLRPESRTRRWTRRLGIFVGISASATIATWPAIWRMSGEIPLSGLWANLVVVPWVSTVLFPVMVAGALLTGIWPWLAGWLLTLSAEGLMALHQVVEWLAYAPLSTLRLGTPTWWEHLGAYLACAIAVALALRPRALVAAAAVMLLAFAPSAAIEIATPPTTSIHFIYVGQGDATLVETADGTAILIDAGGRPVGSDPGLRHVVPYLRHRGIRRLDAVILSHGDYDHYGGLSATIRPFRPRQFFVDADEDHPNVVALIDEMATAGVEIEFVSRSTTIATDDLHLQILRPELPGADANDRSLVVHFTYAGAGVVLPGDIEGPGEAWLVEHLRGHRAVLKTPHHGSRTSSSTDLLEHLRPALAVTSAGRHNRFGHPHAEVMERFEHRGIDHLRTDHHGSVVVTIDDRGQIRARTAHGSPP